MRIRMRKSLVLTAAATFTLALGGCSSVKQEKGPFKDDDWFEPVTATGTGGASSGTTGSGTGGSTTGGGATGSGGSTTGSAGSAMGTGGAGTGGMPPGSGSGGTGNSGCQTFDYRNYQPSATKLTLKADILPLFADSKSGCTLSACHGSAAPNVPKLGPSNGMPDAAGLETVRNALLANSAQVPALKIVSPGKPEESYLMNKIDGTFGCMGFACQTAVGCGERMPQLLAPFDQDKISKVRDWIKQGAAAM